MKPLYSHLLVAITVLLIAIIFSSDERSPTTSSRTRTIERTVRISPDSALADVSYLPPHLRVRGGMTKTGSDALCLDTLLFTDPHAAAPDTLSVCVYKESVQIHYAPSPRKWSHMVSYLRQDSIITIHDSVHSITKISPPWYETLATILLSIAAGVLAGILL